jgi:hypothetical protein
MTRLLQLGGCEKSRHGSVDGASGASAPAGAASTACAPLACPASTRTGRGRGGEAAGAPSSPGDCAIAGCRGAASPGAERQRSSGGLCLRVAPPARPAAAKARRTPQRQRLGARTGAGGEEIWRGALDVAPPPPPQEECSSQRHRPPSARGCLERLRVSRGSGGSISKRSADRHASAATPS